LSASRLAGQAAGSGAAAADCFVRAIGSLVLNGINLPVTASDD
jgi:hypothetical protein